MTRDEYIETIKSTLQRQVLDSVYSSLLSKISFLAWGPLGPVTKKVLEILISHIINKTELALYLQYTDFRVSQQGQAFLKAAIKNDEAQRGVDELAKKRAEKELKDSFRTLVKLSS